MREIDKVAVMGAGTMGSGIAAHCAAKGLDVLLLDMPATEGERNAIAAGAKARMLEGRAPMLDDPTDAERVSVGNFEDDLARAGEADLVIEAIVENLEAKRSLFERLEAVRRDGSILASNTSGIPLRDIAKGMPDRLCREIAVIHFFNPVKVMRLVELVPGADTSAEVVDSLDAFLSGRLEKGVVRAKDTVNFIANRIGCFWMLAGLVEGETALEQGVDLETMDAAMSAPVGVPATGLYGLIDLIGLDVLGLVASNLAENLPADDVGRACVALPAPIQAMLDAGQLGRKSGGGFYRMRETDDGGRMREVYDHHTGAWRDGGQPALSEAEQDLAGLLFSDSAVGDFAWKVMGGTLLYAADLVPEISDDIVGIDRAMRWGFAWKQGPFEMLDCLGPARVAERLDAGGHLLPAMLRILRDSGAESFYRGDGKEFLGADGSWHPVR